MGIVTDGSKVGGAVWYVPLQEPTDFDTEPIETSKVVGIVGRIHDKDAGIIDLLLFGTNDEAEQNLAAFPMLEVGYSAEKVGHSWHWIEKD